MTDNKTPITTAVENMGKAIELIESEYYGAMPKPMLSLLAAKQGDLEDALECNFDERDRLIMEVLSLAYLVDAKTDYCVFLRYSGHVHGQIGIDIRQSKNEWQTEVLKSEFYSAYIEERVKQPPEFAELKAKVKVLRQILTDKEIPYSEVTAEEYVVTNYTF